MWVNGYQEQAHGELRSNALVITHMLLVAKSITDCITWGRRISRWIIPTDPSRANKLTHKLLALAANDIDNRSKISDQTTYQIQSISNSDTNYIHTLENKLDAVINCLVGLVGV